MTIPKIDQSGQLRTSAQKQYVYVAKGDHDHSLPNNTDLCVTWPRTFYFRHIQTNLTWWEKSSKNAKNVLFDFFIYFVKKNSNLVVENLRLVFNMKSNPKKGKNPKKMSHLRFHIFLQKNPNLVAENLRFISNMKKNIQNTS